MKYIASRLSDGNKLFPAEIYLEEDGIKVKIPGFLRGDTQFINYEDIAGVDISTPLVGFSSLTFSFGSNKIPVHGFSEDDAKKIKEGINLGKKKNRFVNQGSTIIEQNYSTDNTIKAKTKEDIDLLYYEKQKEIEFKRKESEQIILDRQSNYNDAKKYLDLGGNKVIYYMKILWAYLDRPWKKLLFIFIIWSVIAGIINYFKK